MTLEGPILIAGLGSIGRRHLRNLQTLGHKKFVLYRTGKGSSPDNEFAGIPLEHDLAKALAHKPAAAVISNPTSLHMKVALAAAKSGAHLFLEKPVSHTMEDVKDLDRLVRKKNLVVQVGYQFRFHPLLRKVKRLLEENAIGPVVSVQAHCGEYLPGWHPEEDYRRSYSAIEGLGGGVILTLSHAFDYLTWLLGKVVSVSAIQSRDGGLGIDVEESADVLLQFKSGATGNVHIDYIEHPAEHFLRIIGQNGVIYWDNSEGLLKWNSNISGKWEKVGAPDGLERNRLFLNEMRHFLSCISKNEQPLCSLDDGIYALRIALCAKESIKDHRIVEVI